MFQQIFDPENGLWRTVGKLVDVVGLSVAWLILCLPVITIGPASAALYYSVVKCVRRGEPRPFQNFWSAFRANLKKGILLTLPCLAVVAFLLWERGMLRYMANGGDRTAMALYVAVTVLLILPVGFACWLFPLLSRFEAGTGQLVRTALQLTLQHLPTTAALAALTYLLAFGSVYFWFLLPFAVTPALDVLLSSFLVERVLKKLTPAEETGEEKPWYLK